jgi:hypothetical protein
VPRAEGGTRDAFVLGEVVSSVLDENRSPLTAVGAFFDFPTVVVETETGIRNPGAAAF